MYSEGVRDLMEMIMMLPFISPDAKKTKLEDIERKATSRYIPVFEKVLHARKGRAH
jgi:glutathione S-transferase